MALIVAIRGRGVTVQRRTHARLLLVWRLVLLVRSRPRSRTQKRSIAIATGIRGIRQRRWLQQTHTHLLVRMRQQVGRDATVRIVTVVHHVRMRGSVEGRGGSAVWLLCVGRCLL